MLSVLLGSVDELLNPLVADERIDLVTFTGSTRIGKLLPKTAGYKKLCLELGGNAPLIILDDAEMELAVTLAAEGCFRNSGQRCTAVKRLLVHEKILADFTERFVEKVKEYPAGDPADEATRVGTVIDEPAAIELENRVKAAVAQGARVLAGGRREGALLEPTVIADVPRAAEMVVEESFGPLAPILAVRDLDDAIELANSSQFGLSSGIVTRDIDAALRAVKSLRTGTVNVNQIPGYRIECSPFGGVKDSGLGIKEGVIEAIKFMSSVKTFSLPW
jgi:aldehyde dehydrogenase (NAD+)